MVILDGTRVTGARDSFYSQRDGNTYPSPSVKIHFDKGQVSDRPAVTFVDLPQIVNAFKYPNYAGLINIMIGYNLFNLAQWWVENYYGELGITKTISGTPFELNDLFRMDSSNRGGIGLGNQVVKELNSPQGQPTEMTRETFEVMCSTNW